MFGIYAILGFAPIIAAVVGIASVIVSAIGIGVQVDAANTAKDENAKLQQKQDNLRLRANAVHQKNKEHQDTITKMNAGTQGMLAKIEAQDVAAKERSARAERVSRGGPDLRKDYHYGIKVQ